MLYIDENILQTDILQSICNTMNKRIVVITDDHLKNIYATLLNKISDVILSFPAGEQSKTRETKQALEDQLLQHHYGRDTCIIAFGGGVVLDLVGFLAATYCRGVPVIYIPTTLLAMVDASIGGKTAVNTPYGKNLIGTFSQPHSVLIDTTLLKTLPPDEMRNGFVEIIKHAMIADAEFFAFLENHPEVIHDSTTMIDIIQKSCLIKQRIVAQDEKDHNVRQLLNFGHTIGHAIEQSENYKIKHGEAVAIGMLVESYLSHHCELLDDKSLQRLHDILRLYQLPLTTNAFHDLDTFQTYLGFDKKNLNQQPRFALLKGISQPHVVAAVDHESLVNALEWAGKVFTTAAQ